MHTRKPTIGPQSSISVGRWSLPHTIITSEPPDTTSNPESNPATTVLNTDTETLTASEDMVEATPVKAVFESAIVILTLVRVSLVLVLFPLLDTYRRRDQDQIKGDSFIELAETCSRKCHVLKGRAEGRDADDLGGLNLNKEIVEDLARCADAAQSSLLTITSYLRTVRDIESVISERVNCTLDLQEHHPGFTNECLIAWLAKVWEILGVLDVRASRFALHTPSKLPQEGLWRGGVLEANEIKHVQGSVDAEPPASTLVVVRRFVASATLSTDCLPDVAYVSFTS